MIRTTAPYEKQVLQNDSLQRAFTGHLNISYDAVISCIRDEEAILGVLGPSEAKGELKKRIKKNKLRGRIEGIG